MRRVLTKRWFWFLWGCLAAVCLVLLAACWYFRIWTYQDYQVYLEVQRYPVGKDLWFGRIRAGEDFEAFIAAYPPHRTRQLGAFTVLTYYSLWPLPPQSIPMEGLSVVAKEGRLVHSVAAGCTWHRVFFSMSPEDEAALDEAYRKKWAQEHEE